MATYEYQGRGITRRGDDADDLEDGDTYSTDDPENDPLLQAFGDRFVERDVDDDVSADVDTAPGAPGEDSDTQTDDVGDLLDGTVDEVRERLDSGEFDDRLDDVAERAERIGVEEAVEERRDE